MEQEQERGITITSAATTCYWSHTETQHDPAPVSYTHLDVYKRQGLRRTSAFPMRNPAMRRQIGSVTTGHRCV